MFLHPFYIDGFWLGEIIKKNKQEIDEMKTLTVKELLEIIEDNSGWDHTTSIYFEEIENGYQYGTATITSTNEDLTVTYKEYPVKNIATGVVELQDPQGGEEWDISGAIIVNNDGQELSEYELASILNEQGLYEFREIAYESHSG